MNKNKGIVNYLKKLWEFMEYHNKMSPFPIYDSEYVQVIKEKLEKMSDDKIDYNNIPTVACKYCNSLGLIQDEVENDICVRCGSINEINIFPTYYDYELYVVNKKNDDN
jgi:DNA-directed RNA polymerase subunit RPC12/RpoP